MATDAAVAAIATSDSGLSVPSWYSSSPMAPKMKISANMMTPVTPSGPIPSPQATAPSARARV